MRIITFLKRIAWMALATAGIRLDSLSPARIALVAANILFFAVMLQAATLPVAIAYFVTAFSVRYIFLFRSFVKGGIADRLAGRFGVERGYRIYEACTATMFFHSGACFSCLLRHTTWLGLPLPDDSKAFILGAGIVLSATGYIVNMWSALIIGVDTYYYKDLFVGRFLGPFKHEGPYRILNNPMYGVGQSAAYGAALMNGSIICLAATMMNQMMMYIFYYVIEKPHIRSVLSLPPNMRLYRAGKLAIMPPRSYGK
ncbi:MAG TPA: PEMT/PEM2 methyltransferase family protein [Candidatus Kapabacteria bacterium]|nr:PEMT/PEM2 methyltransferase family protein [Candidatus Kapabacteria bacterium]